VAVLAVLGYHLLLASVRAGAPPDWINCGARGVDLFFAISGFCLAYPFLRSWRAGGRPEIGYGRFMVRRLLRIAPPYWSALLLFALLSLTGFGLPSAPGTHLDAGAALREFGLEGAFLTNASPAYNASFWTLGIEMRWYLLFPLLLGLYVRSRLGFYALGAACYVLYFFTPWSIGDEGTLPCFMLGIVAADLRITGNPLERYAAGAAVVTLALAAFAQSGTPDIDHGSPLWHAAAFSLVVAASGGTFARVLRFKPLELTGIASYSIYLIHQPVLSSLVAAGINPWLAALAALLCGFAFYLAIERPSLQKRFRDPAQAMLTRLLPTRA
jgi:peptidoglycan/LPS O-acetylase OafA/YrhL